MDLFRHAADTAYKAASVEIAAPKVPLSVWSTLESSFKRGAPAVVDRVADKFRSGDRDVIAG